MSEAVPLPSHPDIERYTNLAYDLQRVCESGETAALSDWARRIIEFQKRDGQAKDCSLPAAQWFIARAHGFASWSEFAAHVEALAREDSMVSKFERAADAIIGGDADTLRTLLHERPDLSRERSTRRHRSTLLHYVSANGVENFRQKTPKNAVGIARMLLDAGADVNAESDAYGGRSTTLGLTATSCHPQAAGVQIALIELLIERGAIIDGPDSGSGVNGCLHNGRGEAAEFFANHGARLDLEGACGVGRLDVVKSFFHADGTLKSSATHKQLLDGFAWACEFGRTGVVEYLLQNGMRADTKLSHGQTGLHWAAYTAQADTVKLLLEHGAPVDAADEEYDGTPLGWALYAWIERTQQPAYYDVVRLLTAAGATIDPQWYEEDEQRKRAKVQLQSDPRMLAALGLE